MIGHMPVSRYVASLAIVSESSEEVYQIVPVIVVDGGILCEIEPPTFSPQLEAESNIFSARIRYVLVKATDP